MFHFSVDAGETRRLWTDESKRAVIKKFGKKWLSNEKISGNEIQNFIDQHDYLHGRTTAQIRSVLQAYEKNFNKTSKTKLKQCASSKTKSKNQKQNRLRVPHSIYACFKDFISEGEVPEISECIDAYKKSPTLTKYKPQELQNLVKKAIDYSESNESSCSD